MGLFCVITACASLSTMATIEIIQSHIDTGINQDLIDNVCESLSSQTHFTIGTQISDSTILQLTASPPGGGHLDLPCLPFTLGRSELHLTTPFNNPLLTSSGPATSPVTEYVQIFFPVSRLTPDFKSQIESDFDRFDALFNKDSFHPGQGEVAYGWAEEEQSHPDLEEAAKCFVVARGWESIRDFEKATQSEGFREGGPILMGWGAPFNMVSTAPPTFLEVFVWKLMDVVVAC